MLSTHFESPTLAKLLRWCRLLRVKGRIDSKYLRTWFGNHTAMKTPSGSTQEFRNSLRAIRGGKWKFEKRPKSVLDELDISNFLPEKEMSASLKEVQLNVLLEAQVAVYISEHWISNTYSIPPKPKLSEPEYPSQVLLWIKQGIDFNVDPRDIVNEV